MDHPVGDGPCDHPATKYLDLPPLGQGGRAAPLVTKTLLFLAEGGTAGARILLRGAGGKMFRPYDQVRALGYAAVVFVVLALAGLLVFGLPSVE